MAENETKQAEAATPKRVTNKTVVMEILYHTPGLYYAIHEVGRLAREKKFMSDNSIATLLNELERAGSTESRFRDGKNFKEWRAKLELTQAALF